ncbi:hypothetical protein C7S10_06395 [Nocardioides currus]|uniref:Fibronectin type-III domain-containing protein n=1 Tax=Nocardioides currus TaxID=2133958 RepID=A0A2R7YZ84_9ACTN|nr:hypothetical protein C7S10_06395 [Nocardioides currus]
MLAAGAVVAYAISADGYQAHKAELNDGGIWVVNGDRGLYGRINKPINQLDTTILSENGSDRQLDVVQDGAAVAAIDRKALTAQVIDPSASKLDPTGKISLPSSGDQQMAGGTFASIDAENGELWAVQLDPQLGRPLITTVDAQGKPLAKVGDGAALAVTQSGTVIATSQGKSTITYLVPSGDAFAKPRSEDLPEDAGDVTSVTAVGETAVTLDEATGALSVIGGPSATMPAESVLQQPGPDADSVLVANPGGLLRVDLETGKATIVDEGRTGVPVEPVRLGACSYAAWSGGIGSVTVQCGDDDAQNSTLGGKAGELAFRVNRGQIVLNDNTSGTVWDLDEQTPEKIDNWNAFTRSKKKKDDDKENQQQSAADRTPPKAEPDSYGARPGRTTVLHPLDNDSAPEGRLLSIVDVDQPTGGASAEISPDGQTIVLEMPDDARDTSFDYYIDDGRSNATAHATVRVGVRTNGENDQPKLRNGFEPRLRRVAANGSVSYPVLSDWRDDGDGDSLILESATVLGAGNTGAVARTTSDGRLRFTGSRDGGDTFQVEYLVSDGRSEPVRQTMSFEVQERLDRETFPAVAEPDVIRGEQGQPIKIRPLLNDLPGSDPGSPDAELAIAAKVPAQDGAQVKTDLETGVITVTASEARTYFLQYDAAYGDAALDKATIRVDVRPKPKSPGEPVAMPDSLTIFGQAAGIVDVLANDLDPAGGLLVVQTATAENRNQVDVAIIDGRWLRISARQGELSPNPQLVNYTISNGANSGVKGEVSVSQRRTPADNSPVTVTDRVHVRSGSSVTAAVLDNDVAPSGDRLSLVGDAAQGVAGELKIERPVGVKGDIGTALVSGRNVRYIAPDLKERDSFEISYIAQTSTGEQAPGKLVVIVTPAKDPNTAPEPPTLESRVVSGGQVKIRLPGSGIDPDGDPVTVNGITSAPRLGRVLGYGGNFLEYQAYPRTTGTDEFEYSVVDSRGAVATGTVRVGIAPPGEPQPILAVADQLTIAPGRTAVFDPMANDYFAPGDKIKLALRDAPDGAKIDPKTNLVSVPAPDTTQGETTPVVYTISDGINTSSATMTLVLSEDFENPPVVADAFGVVDESESVSVDVLEGAYDPDGKASDLEVVEVYGEDGTGGRPTINGSNVKVDRGPNPVVVPFRIEDSSGAAATASLYVPPTGRSIPYVKPGVQIELDEGATAKGKLKDYVVNPSGGPIRLTARQSVSASPSQLQAQRTGDDSFQVTAREGYRGPGAVLLEVTTATNEGGNEDPEDPTDGYTALLSVPVQVGDDTPVLDCPQDTFDISAGQTQELDILTLCNVFTPDPADAPGLTYDGAWTQEVDGLSLSGSGGSVLTVTAADDANQGGEAVLSVTSNGSDPELIRFRLESAPPPDLLQIPSEDLEAGQSRQINLAPYLESGVSDPTPTVVTIEQVSGSGVSASKNGATVTLKAGADTSGRSVFRVVMSDVEDSSSSARRVEGRIEVDVTGVPGQPGTPYDYDNNEEGTIRVGWFPPKDDGGAPITSYVLKEMTKGKTTRCRTNECDVSGLENQKQYNFRVAAVNKVGQGPWSDLSQTAYADTKPARVSNIRMVSRADHTITLGWSRPQSSTTIESYRVTWLGQSVTVPGSSPTTVVTGLDNNQKYVFSVSALNSVGWSPKRESTPLQSIGTPASPGGLAVVDREAGLDATDVSASWTSTPAEGPAPTLYTLAYSVKGGPLTAVPGCSRIQALTCTHTGVPYNGDTYSYYVQASNEKNTSPPGTAVTFQAVGKPAKWGAITATPTGVDNEVLVTGTAPESRGSTARAAILVNGGAVWELAVSPGRVINERVRTAGNGSPYPVQMRMCNEFAATVGCSFSDPVSVTTYGPLNNSHIYSKTPVVEGKSIYWVISGTSNGDAAIIDFQAEGGALQTIRLTSPGAFQIQTSPVATTNYSQKQDMSFRLYDDAPGGRGEGRDSGSATSGEPPLPSISISKGAQCSTASDGTSMPNCSDVKGQGFTCEEASCAFVNVSYDNQRGSVDCRIEVFYNIVGWQYVNSFKMDTGTSGATPRAYWGETGHGLRVNCGNGSYYSNEIGW